MAGAGEQLGFDLLGEQTWARPLIRVTPARLGTWESCPRRYRLTYLVRPAPPRGGPRAASTLGAVVHLALRALFTRPAADRTPEAAAALVDRNWSGEGFRDSAQEHEYRLRARGWMADYCSDRGAEPGPEPLALERWVSAQAGGIVAEGRVDRIDAGPSGDAVIVDYKTGRRVPTPEDARDSAALALYAVATARTLHRPSRRVELHHLPTGTVAAWEHDEESLAGHVARAEKGALQAAEAAESGSETAFPPRPGRQCPACDMRRNCPEGQAVGPQAPAWEGLAP
ncbi:PD-(D/E)XK nuclease family protein [Pseudonocardia ailaonensis]|uniref:PD-(D/E)XK nuclease family protein n=1 Tax=Pseudonocardia ailaonensis TaxID=367279 RepID=A0ABN2MXY8_9PSEU